MLKRILVEKAGNAMTIVNVQATDALVSLAFKISDEGVCLFIISDFSDYTLNKTCIPGIGQYRINQGCYENWLKKFSNSC